MALQQSISCALALEKVLTTTDLGSSRNVTIPSNSGFLSSNPEVNPDFYNWNTVFFVYCDGGSFAGDRYIIIDEVYTITGL